MLAAWLVDAVLAQWLDWPFALPLLTASLSSGTGRRAGGLENPAEGVETTRVLFAYANAAVGGEAVEGRAQIARQGGRGRVAGSARRGLPRRIVRNCRANIGARCAAAVRPAGRAWRDPGTDRTRDLPALWALSHGAPGNLQGNSTSNSGTCRRRRAGANGWAGSKRSFSPPPSRCCVRALRASSAAAAISS